MKEIRKKEFSNGVVYLLETHDGYPVEVTDTYLPYYTKDAIGRKQNSLDNYDLADRGQRWMIGVSCMSGCPVKCKFCATGKLKKWRNLKSSEIIEQIEFVLNKNKKYKFNNAKEYKINYTRMGEPFLNINHVRNTIKVIENNYPGTHHYLSTIGIKNADYSFIKDNITLQLSVHSLKENKRNWLIPYSNKITYKEMSKIKTKSKLKTTINMTLIDREDFDINELQKLFNKDNFFVKLSPINKNDVSEKNNCGNGFVEGINLI
jgi:23S rRNA (adenine2503-C2)-methyltransferase